MSQHIELTGEFQDHQFGQRLDQALAELFPDYSRTRIKEWILQDRVTLDGQVANTPREKVVAGQQVHVDVELEDDTRWDAQNIDLNIVYEDEHILVIDKPAGLVVHPGAGTPDGTILNALLHRYPTIAEVPRAGIVHRLDKDTTGLMVVAKTIQAQTQLVTQLQSRSVSRIYECIVIGVVTAGGKIDAPIGRHGQQRQRMAVMEGGKQAVSHYRVLERFRSHTHVRVKLETGRTHQIRVHLASQGHAIVGDDKYGDFDLNKRLPKQGLKRMFLHAWRLVFTHPASGERTTLHAELPQELVDFVASAPLASP